MKVNYVDHLGDDLLVANCLRRSFNSQHDTWSEVPRTPRGRSDRQLIEDCAKDGHELPFRHPHVILECDAPIPIARQLGKHQVGFEWSEVSRRYKTKDIVFYRLDGKWRSDVKDRRQGSGPLLSEYDQRQLELIQCRNIANALEDYEEVLNIGGAPEQARMLLPQSMEVLWTWTGSLLGWANLVKKRNHPDAQQETREFAQQVDQIIRPLYPVSWAALMGEK